MTLINLLHRMQQRPSLANAPGHDGGKVSVRDPWGLALEILLPLAYLATMVMFFPFRYVFEFSPDEGINAMKALLSLRGYHLYAEIWSDQPPVFTFLLALSFHLFGLRVVVGRFLVLVFSVGLVAAAVSYLRRSWGIKAGIAGLLILALLPNYRQLSVSILIGLPSVALAVISFWAQARWHERHRRLWLVLSGSCLALSVLTKAFTAVLVPVWVVGLVLAQATELIRGPMRWRTWAPLLTWAVPFAAIGGLALLLVVRLENIDQLTQVHLTANGVEVFQPSGAFPSIDTYLRELIPLFLLAALGTFRAIRARAWSAMYLVGWTAAGYAFLARLHPTWPHHQILVTVPVAILAAIGVATAIDESLALILRRDRLPYRYLAPAAALLLTLAFLAERVAPTMREFDGRWPNLSGPPSGDWQQKQIVALMWDYAPRTTWVYTDRPMFAFLTGLPVPPHLAVLTQKRLETGALTEPEILAVLEEYRPEMVFTARFELAAVQDYMRARRFDRVDGTYKYRLYVREDIR